MMKYTRYIWIIIALFLITGCNRKAKLAVEDSTDASASFRKSLERFENKIIQPEWFFSRAQINLDLKEFKTTVSARILLQTNKRALVSVKKFGAELFRAFATPDSVIVVDRFRKQYFFASGDDLNEMKLPFTFESLQSLLLGSPYYQGIDDYEISDEGTSFQSYADPYILKYYFDQDFYLRNCIFENNDQSQKVESQLNEYISLASNKIFSNQRDITWFSKGQAQGNVSVEFKDIELDVPKEFKISIPSSYSKMEF